MVSLLDPRHAHKQINSNGDKRTIGKDYVEQSIECLEYIAPQKHRTEEAQKKDYLRQQQNANRQKRKREN